MSMSKQRHEENVIMTMKTAAVIYASSRGTTEKIARQIQKGLQAENTALINLKTTKTIDLSRFDTVIIGGSIHAGQMQRRVKSFCKQHLADLLQKRIGLFMCGMNEPEFENEFTNAFPEPLRKHAISSKCVGGEFVFEKMNFLEKLIVKKVSGISKDIAKINEGKVAELLLEINKESSSP